MRQKVTKMRKSFDDKKKRNKFLNSEYFLWHTSTDPYRRRIDTHNWTIFMITKRMLKRSVMVTEMTMIQK